LPCPAPPSAGTTANQPAAAHSGRRRFCMIGVGAALVAGRGRGGRRRSGGVPCPPAIAAAAIQALCNSPGWGGSISSPGGSLRSFGLRARHLIKAPSGAALLHSMAPRYGKQMQVENPLQAPILSPARGGFWLAWGGATCLSAGRSGTPGSSARTIKAPSGAALLQSEQVGAGFKPRTLPKAPGPVRLGKYLQPAPQANCSLGCKLRSITGGPAATIFLTLRMTRYILSRRGLVR